MDIACTAAERIRERIPEGLAEVYEELGSGVVVLVPEHMHDALQALRDAGFNLLSDLSGVDFYPRDPRFEVNYHLYSFDTNTRLRAKVRLNGDAPSIPTVVDVWPGANWMEREVWDLLGITFTGHPDLRRILLPDEWEGHPHRKDYPVGGVPVEYKIEPAYIGEAQVSDRGRPSMGGVPARLRGDRGKASRWTWTGAPASGVRVPPPPVTQEAPVEDAERPGDGS